MLLSSVTKAGQLHPVRGSAEEASSSCCGNTRVHRDRGLRNPDRHYVPHDPGSSRETQLGAAPFMVLASS